jgi:RecA-family ATPase
MSTVYDFQFTDPKGQDSAKRGPQPPGATFHQADGGEPEPAEPMKWSDALIAGPVFSTDLPTLTIKERPKVIDEWCKAGDLGFIFAARGVGKTWLGMHLACGLACNKNAGPWGISREWKVLYIDGEMPVSDIVVRHRVLGDWTRNLAYINHEILFDRTGRIINLADGDFQREMLIYCKREKFEVVFLDNLSTLACGVDENKSIDWELIQPWLLQLRRLGVTVIFIHHAGRNNQMRGSSKREDPASWNTTIGLSPQ